MERLLAIAESSGICVAFRPLNLVGFYVHSRALIVLNSRRTERDLRIALAHELGHAYYGHEWGSEHDEIRDELQADMFAARILIHPDAYAAAENLVGCDVAALAKELRVTRRHIELRQEDFARDAKILATVEVWRQQTTWAS